MSSNVGLTNPEPIYDVSGNNGTISCDQWCFMNGYSNASGVNTDTLTNSPTTCSCMYPNTVSSVAGYNGSISCGEWCNLNNAGIGVGSYNGNTKITDSQNYPIDDASASSLSCYCKKMDDIGDIISYPGNNGNVSCNQWCNMSGRSMSVGCYDASAPFKYVDPMTNYNKSVNTYCGSRPTVTEVTGNDTGNVSCNQWCFVHGYNGAAASYYNTNTVMDPDKVINPNSTTNVAPVHCYCANPNNSITTIYGNDGTYSSDEWCLLNGHLSSAGSYNGTASLPNRSVPFGYTATGIVNYCRNPAGSTVNVPGNDGSVSCDDWCQKNGYTTANGAFDKNHTAFLTTMTNPSKDLQCYCSSQRITTTPAPNPMTTIPAPTPEPYFMTTTTL